MSSLKTKTVSGLLWSFIEQFSKLGVAFIIGIILARLLSPSEFGLIGMISIFIALSHSLVESGFSQALIRKKKCTQADYSTVFYFNILVSIILYTILFFSSNAISHFFNESQLALILKVIGLVIIINSFVYVQKAILVKEVNFKLQTKISIIAYLIAGITAIVLAYMGFGVWSLVVNTLLRIVMITFLFWYLNKWRPSLVFNRKSFNEMFSFGYKLLIVGLIETLYKNIYLVIIGKYYSAAELGFYSRADLFKNLPSQTITSGIQRVAYPVLSEIKDDLPRLKIAFKKIIKSTVLITFTAMLMMAAIAEPLILSVLGEKWLSSVIYLQLLCFVGIFYPLDALNLTMLNVQGRTDLSLKLEIIKKVLTVPVIVIAITLGIKMMILGMIALSLINYFLNSYYSGKHLDYSSSQQLKDVLPSFVLAVSIAAIVYFVGQSLVLPNYLILIIQLGIGLVLFISLAQIFKMKDYYYVKQIVLNKFITQKNNQKK
jgi:O-antigen/teichoic acid export membrane protein